MVKISIECFVRAYSFALFLSALCRPIGGAVIRQSLSILHLFKFFVVRQVCGTVVDSAYIVLVYGGVGNNQSKILHVRNFQGLSAETANGPP